MTMEARKKRLERQLANLMEEHAEVMQQFESTTDARVETRLERQLVNLEEEMRGIEDELKQIELLEEKPLQTYIEFDEYFPKIDFHKPLEEFRRSLEQCDSSCGSVMFLAHNSQTMEGKWLIPLMKYEFDPRWYEVKHLRVEFLSVENLNFVELLKKLSKHLGVPSSVDMIINKICEPLKDNSIVIIEISIWKISESDKSFLSSFINDFWTPLSCKWLTLERPEVRFLTTMVVSSPMSRDVRGLLRTIGERNSSGRMVNLSLTKWEERHILKWLRLSPIAHKGSANIDQMAKHAYQISRRGTPQPIREYLQECWKEHYLRKAEYERAI